MNEVDNSLTRDNLLRRLQLNWNELQTFLDSLTAEQMTRPTDAAGWTVKDHVIHLAAWAQGGLAVLDRQSKRQAMAIPAEIWQQGDDPINAVLQQRYRDMPLDEVLRTLRQTHDRVLKKLDTMTEADLLLPRSQYDPDSNDENPIIRVVIGDTVLHYVEHIPWMAAIVEQG